MEKWTDERITELEQLLLAAADAINAGVELMTLEQLSEWAGHAAVLHRIYDLVERAHEDAGCGPAGGNHD